VTASKKAIKRTLNVMLVDDHDAVRAGWKDLLGRSPEFNVVATAESGETAMEIVEKHSPDICLVDLKLQGVLAGPALIKALLEAVPKTRVVVLTIYGEPEDIVACLAAGASGYLSKDSTHQELMDSINFVISGKLVVDFGISFQRLLATFVSQAPSEGPIPELSPREIQVLRLVAGGLSNSEIGDALGIAERTVKNTLSSAMRKLRAPNRTAAVMIARDEDLI
jgi:DNA-binding NarL/FixJ family response regulator